MKALRIPALLTLVTVWLGLAASAQILPDNFGWQCGPGKTSNCPINNNVLQWPPSPPMPNLLRLHDSETEWSEIEQSQGSYTWTDLDAYLNAIANHPGTTVMETFTAIPCWAAGISPQNCTGIDDYKHGTNIIPTDLANNPPGGSPSFNDFVTAFVTHCTSTAPLNCVGPCPQFATCNATFLIQYFDMWNEWDMPSHWNPGAPPTGCGLTASACAQLLYYMVAPAVSIIKQHIPNAVILMPSATMGSASYQCDLAAWLNTENTNNNGQHISNVVNWHAYLTSALYGPGTTNTPEYQWANFGAKFLAVQNSTSYSTGCGLPKGTSYNTSGWASAPWVDSETNFIGNAGSYTCPISTQIPPPSGKYSEIDCAGQIARWQLLHDSNGASNLSWYYGNTTINPNPPLSPVSYATVYTNLQTYLIGSTPSGACQSSGSGTQTWTCDYTQGNGKKARFVWACTLGANGYCTATTSIFTYNATEYSSYRNLSNSSQNWNPIAGGTVTIGAVPVELE